MLTLVEFHSFHKFETRGLEKAKQLLPNFLVLKRNRFIRLADSGEENLGNIVTCNGPKLEEFKITIYVEHRGGKVK